MMRDYNGLLLNFVEPTNERLYVQIAVIRATVVQQRSGRLLYARPAKVLRVTANRVHQIVKQSKTLADRTYRVIDDELMHELAAKAHDLSGLCDA